MSAIKPKRSTGLRVFRAMWPWILTIVVGGILALILWARVRSQQKGQPIVLHDKRALVLLAGGVIVALIAFHLQRWRSASMGFSQTALVTKRGAMSWLADVPGVLRVVAVLAIPFALARPETFRTIEKVEDAIDIMIVVDMSKSMEETDLPRDRLDAAQRVIRRFLRRTKNDRVGLVIFGQQAMLQCPLTQDTKMLEQIVADLSIGDVPELGTAIGDGLALALAQLRRSDAKSKIVILLSDGDSNWVTKFNPEQAAAQAKDMKIPVYTLLVGKEDNDVLGGMSVNPATLRNMASITGGEFFRATDYETFDKGFQTVRNRLDTTKRIHTEKVIDKQLFVPFALSAILLLVVEMLLAFGRLRRLP